MRLFPLILCCLSLGGCGIHNTPAPEKLETPVPTFYTPNPGINPLASPPITFVTGTINVAIGPGGTFTPNTVYLRPGATTIIINRDSRPHTFVGFGGATSASGPIAPGETFSHNWIHPGTWTFHDTLTPNAPTFTAITIPEQ